MSKKITSGVNSGNSVNVDLDKVNNFFKNFNEDYFVKVGVLGKSNTRKMQDDKKNIKNYPTNAQIGLKHEKGSFSERIPKRSFLLMPLHTKYNEILKDVKKTSKELLRKGDFMQILENLGISCVGHIQDAFHTGGFGKWEKLSYFTISRKIQKNPSPLVDTRQLEKSIMYEVKKK